MRTRLSQNFLVNLSVAAQIVEGMNLSKDDPVLEIGPGRGILTQILIEKTGSLTVAEIDPKLSANLLTRWGGRETFRLIQGDFLELDLNHAFPGTQKKIKVIGNLPYAVTSPILQKIIAWKGWSEAVFMVQKEVGERIRSEPGSKDYGVLTVSVQASCRVEKILDVSNQAFWPVPKVQSSVLKLVPLPQRIFAPEEETFFFRTVKAGFAQRRKAILNSRGRALNIPPEKIKLALKTCGISRTARAETVPVQDFARLSRILYNR